MRSHRSSFSMYLAFTVFAWGCLAFTQSAPVETSSDINPILDTLFLEWMKKQSAQPEPVANEDSEPVPQVDSPTATEPPQSLQQPPVEVPAAPTPAVNPFLAQFAPNPFFPQLPVNPALGSLPPSPYIDPMMLNPYLYPYSPFNPFGPFPMKIKKNKV